MINTIDDLIRELQAMRTTHGGGTVVAVGDADTGWHLAIDSLEFDERNTRIIVRGLYQDEMSRAPK